MSVVPAPISRAESARRSKTGARKRQAAKGIFDAGLGSAVMEN